MRCDRDELWMFLAWAMLVVALCGTPSCMAYTFGLRMAQGF